MNGTSYQINVTTVATSTHTLIHRKNKLPTIVTKGMNCMSVALALLEHKGRADDGAFFDGPNWGTHVLDTSLIGPPTSLPSPKLSRTTCPSNNRSKEFMNIKEQHGWTYDQMNPNIIRDEGSKSPKTRPSLHVRSPSRTSNIYVNGRNAWFYPAKEQISSWRVLNRHNSLCTHFL